MEFVCICPTPSLPGSQKPPKTKQKPPQTEHNPPRSQVWHGTLFLSLPQAHFRAYSSGITDESKWEEKG